MEVYYTCSDLCGPVKHDAIRVGNVFCEAMGEDQKKARGGFPSLIVKTDRETPHEGELGLRLGKT